MDKKIKKTNQTKTKHKKQPKETHVKQNKMKEKERENREILRGRGKKVTLPTHPIFFNGFARVFFIFYLFLHLEHNPFAIAYLFC